MAWSIGEQIMQALMTALGPSIAGATVVRSKATSYAISALPAVNVMQIGGPADQVVVPKLQWEKTVHLMIFVRGDVPDQIADPIKLAVNAALMVDESLGGLALQIMPASDHYAFSDADGTVCVLTLEYKIQYRTDQLNLASQ